MNKFSNGKITFTVNPPTYDSIRDDLSTKLSNDTWTVNTIRDFFSTSSKQQYCLLGNVCLTSN